MADNNSESNDSAPYQVTAKPRRFIAGAVCPRCAAMDRIVVHADGETRECIDCGFSDARPTAGPEAVPTRVTRPVARRVETAAEPVRLLDPRSPKDSE
ncbi:YheV family putative metal-binding protein [Flavobacteriaceae bacterium]|nr:YheV family putative metal-binding protein [Flavobacteriaceae bacterium]